MQKKIILTVFLTLTIVLMAYVVPATAQTVTPEPVPAQVNLGNISGAVVTLYYYDEATGGKGDMVKVPDNPQYVQWDEQAAAPGTYTFSRVPEGKYYIEAVHNNNSWFAIATVYKGTTTANVAIPPRNWTPEPTVVPSATAAPTPLPSVMPTAAATGTPLPSPTATQTPGMGIEAVLAGIGLISLYLLRKK
ncbi:hypothetical protein [Methanocella sp. MCL-LM]|uniref:hypothetical protein n=1 Tax=Methanocella sp. MCL-LM TaxID=3412035 RepID=UPI003C7318CB